MSKIIYSFRVKDPETTPELVRNGPTGAYVHETLSEKEFSFEDAKQAYQKQKEFFQESIKRMDEGRFPLIISEVECCEWPPWGKDTCG